MDNLLLARDKVRTLYGRYDMIIDPVVRFVLMLFSVLVINRKIGYMPALKDPFITVILSLFAALVPYRVLNWILAGVILVHIYSLSFEMAVIVGLFLMAVAILYYGFRPGDSYILFLTPLLFYCRIPYIIPLLAGLIGTPVSAVPAVCGTVLYYMLRYTATVSATMTELNKLQITDKFITLIKGMLIDRNMAVMAAVVAVGVTVVYIVRIIPFNYSRYISVPSGAAAMMIVSAVGMRAFGAGGSVIYNILMILVCMIIVSAINILLLPLDYRRVEITQFEDDDYVYYVKAVPKYKPEGSGNTASGGKKRGNES